jgi:Ca2+-binding RTX toxin-like protein
MTTIAAPRARAREPITVTEGSDLILGSRRADLIGGRGGDDLILARAGDDRIFGDNIGEPGGPFEIGPLPPQFGGTPGDNLIFAGRGDDFVTAGFGADIVFGGTGDDEIRGYGVFADSTTAAADVISADEPDRLFGGRGNDLIYGGGGDDLLIGGKGKDVLTGGVGVDTLIGGPDDDVFAFGFSHEPGFGQAPSVLTFILDTGAGPGNRDLIQDFHQGEDKIDLSFARPAGRTGGLPPEFLGTDPFGTSFALQVRYEFQDGRTIVQFATFIGNPPSPPTPSAPSGEIELIGIHHLTEADFTFELPPPSPPSLTYVEYGDTSGTLEGSQRGGDQTLPVGQPTTPGPLNTVRLFGDADALRDDAVGGNDRLDNTNLQLNGELFLTGDARAISDFARGGDDVLIAVGNPHNTLYGDATEMSGHAEGGSDDLTGGTVGARIATSNSLHGDAFSMSDDTRGGDDRVTGASGRRSSENLLYGDANTMLGNARGGDDIIFGGAGSIDAMWGDAAMIEGEGVLTGRDTFVIGPGNGADRIHDFEPGKDRIDLTGYASMGVHGFADLGPLTSITPEGSFILFRTFMELQEGTVTDSLLVLGERELTEADFLFA